jgi:hypothetical protein
MTAEGRFLFLWQKYAGEPYAASHNLEKRIQTAFSLP